MNADTRPPTTDKSNKTAPELDIYLMSGLIVAGAAVLSFNSTRDLANMCGFHDWLSWVWPVCLDAVAYVSTRIWLSRNTDNHTRTYARSLALIAIGLSLAANGLDLFLIVEKLSPAWGVVLLVGAIPPATLAAVIHMLVMRRGLIAGRRTATRPATVTPPVRKPKTEPVAPTAADPTPTVVTEPETEPLATVTELAGARPDWLTDGMELADAITHYLIDNPEARPSDVHTHIGAHLGKSPDTTRKALARLRNKRARAVGEE